MVGRAIAPGQTRPFLKWAGGKRWLTPLLVEVADGAEGGYVEPFLGAGSMFFALLPSSALLSDSNSELVETFQVLRDSPEAVIRGLRQRRDDRLYFEAVRSRVPNDPVTRATRFIYLNRTAFNGLYRVNMKGEFNVPYGSKPGTVICDPTLLRACSHALARAELRTASFQEVLGGVPAEALVYLDPPYTVAHNNNGFVRYNERLFHWRDQLELAAWARERAKAGGSVIVTNAANPEVLRQYPSRLFRRMFVSRFSRMAADPSRRQVFTELLLVSRSLSAGRHLLNRAARVGVVASDIDG